MSTALAILFVWVVLGIVAVGAYNLAKYHHRGDR